MKKTTNNVSQHAIDFVRRFMAVIIAVALPGLSASAQQLNLFEEIESNNNAASEARERGRGNNRATNAVPEFTLVGTTRIGNNYSAIIRHRDGDTLVVKSAPDSPTAIPGHNEYALLEVRAGRASIRYPQSNPCAEFLDRGVSCSGGNTAALSLANGAPVMDEVVEQTEEESPTNPFEALRDQQENDAPANNGRFTPRRIAPEDVPPGMRIVSTPFGDRLVEQ